MKQHASPVRIVVLLASIFSFRMLGIFMLLPVFTLYATNLTGATSLLLGIALGIYGLTQALFQIPLGTLSDKYGRKLIITIGLIIFALGSLLAAVSHTIWLMIVARALQGSGAIGSALIALLTDLTDQQHRTKAMATLGMFIGVSFALALVLGPIMAKHWGLAGIFWFITCLACLGIIILNSFIPTPVTLLPHNSTVPVLFKKVLTNRELLRLDVGIFFQHAIFTATFYVLPLLLASQLTHQWYFYLPIMLLSFAIMLPLMIIAEKKRQLKAVFIGAIGLLLISQLCLIIFQHNLIWLVPVCFIFFCGFNLLEALLPSMVSKIAPIESKGTAMGVYSSSQFLGIFVGGALAGILYQHFNAIGVFSGSAFMALLWIIIAANMKQPPYVTTRATGLV